MRRGSRTGHHVNIARPRRESRYSDPGDLAHGPAPRSAQCAAVRYRHRKDPISAFSTLTPMQGDARQPTARQRLALLPQRAVRCPNLKNQRKVADEDKNERDNERAPEAQERHDDPPWVLLRSQCACRCGDSCLVLGGLNLGQGSVVDGFVRALRVPPVDTIQSLELELGRRRARRIGRG